MKYLKLFERHLNESEVAKICKNYQISNWTLNSDGTVDVDGDVDLERKKLTKLPLNFGRVEYYFDCDSNNLSSLERCPKYVGGDFRCARNLLTSLEGCPKYVGGDFYCYGNELTSLVGSNQYIGGDFYCQYNNIRSFEGIGHISGNFFCNNNPIHALWRLFSDISKIEIFNEWGVIQNDKVILYRLNDFLAEIGGDDVTDEQLNRIKKYYTVL